MNASAGKLEWQDYYVGGIPPLALFYERIEEIKRLASHSPQETFWFIAEESSRSNTKGEISRINYKRT